MDEEKSRLENTMEVSWLVYRASSSTEPARLIIRPLRYKKELLLITIVYIASQVHPSLRFYFLDFRSLERMLIVLRGSAKFLYFCFRKSSQLTDEQKKRLDSVSCFHGIIR